MPDKMPIHSLEKVLFLHSSHYKINVSECWLLMAKRQKIAWVIKTIFIIYIAEIETKLLPTVRK